MSIILDPKNEVILAYEMDGKPLTPDHGYPLKLIVPGSLGGRNTKWLGKLTISDKEADTPYQKRDYKYFREKDWTLTSPDDLPAVYTDVVNSAIIFPHDG